jgi:hypothetical protein
MPNVNRSRSAEEVGIESVCGGVNGLAEFEKASDRRTGLVLQREIMV